MSIVVKGMEIPKNCTLCDSIGLNVAIGCPVMTGINGRATDCPLVELPEKHGRLIDADALKADYDMGDDCNDCKTGWKECQYNHTYTKMDFCGWLDDAETVIEAEGQENEI